MSNEVLATYTVATRTTQLLGISSAPLDKDIRIGAGCDLAHAIACLGDFVKNYKDTHHGYGHPVLYGLAAGRGVCVYQTATQYVVRKNYGGDELPQHGEE